MWRVSFQYPLGVLVVGIALVAPALGWSTGCRVGLRTLYPEIEPFASFHLPVGDGHELYVERSGNPVGIPVLLVHGGPGSGTRPDHRRFFDPKRYHIILVDQRGAGQSRPFGSLVENRTQKLMTD